MENISNVIDQVVENLRKNQQQEEKGCQLINEDWKQSIIDNFGLDFNFDGVRELTDGKIKELEQEIQLVKSNKSKIQESLEGIPDPKKVSIHSDVVFIEYSIDHQIMVRLKRGTVNFMFRDKNLTKERFIGGLK